MMQSTVRFKPKGVSRLPVAQSRHDYSTGNVTSAAWVEIVSALPDEVDGIEIFDSSGVDLILGIGLAGFEVEQLIIFPGGNGLIEIQIPTGSRVALKAGSASSATAGLSLINFYSR